MSKYPNSIRIVEVGPRDGLQSIPSIIGTEDKIHFVNLLSEAGLSEIEVASFVSPKWVPQMADGAEVFGKIKRRRTTIYTALIPNLRGLHSAIDDGFQSVAVMAAASETFSQKNMNCSVNDSFERLKQMKPVWTEYDLRVRGYISTSWYCPYEGYVDPEAVLLAVEHLFARGIDELSLGDTIGRAEPDDVRRLLDILLKRWDVNDFALHFHDTNGQALENIKVGLEYGIRVYDASVSGIGGCPYAPGALGNVSTEAIVNLCDELHIKHYLKTDRLYAAGEFINSVLAKTNAEVNI